MKYQRGIILISILIFINLLSLMWLFTETAVEIQARMNRNFYLRAQDFQLAQSALNAAYQEIKAGNAVCEIAQISPKLLAIKPPSWWKSSLTCHHNLFGTPYEYVSERLNNDPCTTIDHNNSIQYWRITVHISQPVIVVLQTSVATSVQIPISKQCRHVQFITNVWRNWIELR